MCFDLVVLADSIVEESEVFFVSLSSEDSAVRSPEEASVLSITIVDNDSKIQEKNVNSLFNLSNCSTLGIYGTAKLLG